MTEWFCRVLISFPPALFPSEVPPAFLYRADKQSEVKESSRIRTPPFGHLSVHPTGCRNGAIVNACFVVVPCAGSDMAGLARVSTVLRRNQVNVEQPDQSHREKKFALSD